MENERNETDPLLIDYDLRNGDDDDDEINIESEQPNKSLGFLSVIFLTVNATLGAGLLNIPYSFDNSGGIIFALVLQIFHVTLVIGSLMIISFATKISKVNSLQNLVEYFCGSSWSNLCACSIFIYSYGACITYLIVIGDQFDKILEFYYGADYYKYWYLHRNFLVMAIAIIAILPL
ncbi:Transmembrane amino acid transporter protein-like protein, partial [Euroglyphus maynei]